MSRLALFLVALASLPLSSPVWALSQSSACRATSPARWSVAPDGPMCLLVQDPWQDCDEDPWQLTSTTQPSDAFSDPWQDDIDPWQPVLPASTQMPPDSAGDPWQPVSLIPGPDVTPTLDAFEDPWQPSVIDPWQDAAEDPWQLP